MSISINTYGSTSYYVTTQSDSSNSVTGRQHVHRRPSPSITGTELGTSTDSVQFSQELMEYLAGNQNQAPVPTGNYGSDSSEHSLTTDQKKSILADMQNKLSSLRSAQTDSNVAGSADNIFSTIKGELSGFDASTATDEQVSDLFDEVAQTLEQSRPPQFNGVSLQQTAGNSGLPPMIKAMGGIVPPFAWDLSGSQDAQQSGNDAENTLTTDQKKAILADMQNELSSLQSFQSGSNDSSNTDKTISTIKDELSGFDLSAATDEQVSDLFDEITQALEQSRPSFNR